VSASEGKRVFKFLVQMEFGERTRWEPGFRMADLVSGLERVCEHAARLVTAGPEPRVTVILEESREAGTLKG